MFNSKVIGKSIIDPDWFLQELWSITNSNVILCLQHLFFMLGLIPIGLLVSYVNIFIGKHCSKTPTSRNRYWYSIQYQIPVSTGKIIVSKKWSIILYPSTFVTVLASRASFGRPHLQKSPFTTSKIFCKEFLKNSISSIYLNIFHFNIIPMA